MAIYFDNAAAMPPSEGVRNFLHDSLAKDFANQEAGHSLAYRTAQRLLDSGKEISKLLLGRTDCHVVWGSSATELIQVLARCPLWSHAVITVLEHPALTANFRRTGKITTAGCRPDGTVTTPPELKTADIAVCHHVQSELGVIQDCEAFFQEAGPATFRLVDAVQSAGKLELPDNADGWLISGSKFGAPGGAALLLSPRHPKFRKLKDFFAAARSQEHWLSRIQPATALTLAYALREQLSAQPVSRQKVADLNAAVRRGCHDLGLLATLPGEVRQSPYIVNFRLPAPYQSAIIVRALSQLEIYVASGSACEAESGRPSAALTAIGLRGADRYRTLRISFNTHNAIEEVQKFVFCLKQVLQNY